jgi:hypothetical protein
MFISAHAESLKLLTLGNRPKSIAADVNRRQYCFTLILFYGNWKISSTGTPKYRAIRRARAVEGV